MILRLDFLGLAQSRPQVQSLQVYRPDSQTWHELAAGESAIKCCYSSERAQQQLGPRVSLRKLSCDGHLLAVSPCARHDVAPRPGAFVINTGDIMQVRGRAGGVLSMRPCA
jgi:hypothetical protein